MNDLHFTYKGTEVSSNFKECSEKVSHRASAQILLHLNAMPLQSHLLLLLYS